MDSLSADVLHYSLSPFLVPCERLKLARLCKFLHKIFYQDYYFDDEFDTKYWTRYFHHFYIKRQMVVRDPDSNHLYIRYSTDAVRILVAKLRKIQSNNVELGTFEISAVSGKRVSYYKRWESLNAVKKQQLKYFLINQNYTLHTYIPRMYIDIIKFSELGETFHSIRLREILRAKEKEKEKEEEKLQQQQHEMKSETDKQDDGEKSEKKNTDKIDANVTNTTQRTEKKEKENPNADNASNTKQEKPDNVGVDDAKNQDKNEKSTQKKPHIANKKTIFAKHGIIENKNKATVLNALKSATGDHRLFLSGQAQITENDKHYYNFSIIRDVFKHGTMGSLIHIRQLIIRKCGLDTECIMDLALGIEANPKLRCIINNNSNNNNNNNDYDNNDDNDNDKKQGDTISIVKNDENKENDEKITDVINEKIVGLPNLEYLDFSYNNLDCDTKNEVEFWKYFFNDIIYNYMKKLQIIDLGHNQLNYNSMANIIYDYYIKWVDTQSSDGIGICRLYNITINNQRMKQSMWLEKRQKLGLLLQDRKLPDDLWIKWYYQSGSDNQRTNYTSSSSSSRGGCGYSLMQELRIRRRDAMTGGPGSSSGTPELRMMRDWLFRVGCCNGLVYNAKFERKDIKQLILNPTQFRVVPQSRWDTSSESSGSSWGSTD